MRTLRAPVLNMSQIPKEESFVSEQDIWPLQGSQVLPFRPEGATEAGATLQKMLHERPRPRRRPRSQRCPVITSSACR